MGSGFLCEEMKCSDLDSGDRCTALQRDDESFGEGNGNPLQSSYLENPMNRGAWRARVHGVAELDTTE